MPLTTEMWSESYDKRMNSPAFLTRCYRCRGDGFIPHHLPDTRNHVVIAGKILCSCVTIPEIETLKKEIETNKETIAKLQSQMDRIYSALNNISKPE